MDINLHVYLHEDESRRDRDADLSEAIDALGHDLNYWAELAWETLLNKPVPLGRERSSMDQFSDLLKRMGGDEPEIKTTNYTTTLDHVRDTLNHLDGLGTVSGHSAKHRRGASALAACAVLPGSKAFDDLAGSVALATPLAGGGITLQFWPLEDAKTLLNRIGDAISEAERLAHPETDHA